MSWRRRRPTRRRARTRRRAGTRSAVRLEAKTSCSCSMPSASTTTWQELRERELLRDTCASQGPRTGSRTIST
eukprot:4293005-Heterocapsa_arctica.AAC.1